VPNPGASVLAALVDAAGPEVAASSGAVAGPVIVPAASVPAAVVAVVVGEHGPRSKDTATLSAVPAALAVAAGVADSSEVDAGRKLTVHMFADFAMASGHGWTTYARIAML